MNVIVVAEHFWQTWDKIGGGGGGGFGRVTSYEVDMHGFAGKKGYFSHWKSERAVNISRMCVAGLHLIVCLLPILGNLYETSTGYVSLPENVLMYSYSTEIISKMYYISNGPQNSLLSLVDFLLFLPLSGSRNNLTSEAAC
jgi:hypothetical protein